MKHKLTFIIATLLLSSVTFADSREIIYMTTEQRDEVLHEMRQLLASGQQVLEGVLSKDMELVEKAARTSGMNMGRSTPAAVAKLLPDGFKAIGPRVHKGFERMANEADGFGDTNKILNTLNETQKLCVSCHEIYQIQIRK